MRINSSSHPTSITQLNRANAELVNFLQSRAESAVGILLQRVNSRSVSSGRDALSISSLTTLPVSQRGLFAVLGGDGAGTALGSDPLLRQARTVRFSVVDRLSQVGSFAIGLDAASLGGTRGTLQQLATGGGKAGLGAHATDAITISQQALAYISNVESLLDQAAARDAPSSLSLQSVSSTRSANLRLLAIRNALQSGDNRVVESIQHDPQRVLQLLTSKTW